MRRQDLDYLIVAGMLVSGLYASVSGLLAGLFGFPQFVLHRWAGYVCAGLIVLHLALHLDRLGAYLRRRLGGSARIERIPPARPVPALQSGRRGFLVAALAGLGGFLAGWLVPRTTLEDDDLGQRYHDWSKPGAAGLAGVVLDGGSRPEPYKLYRQAARVVLPDPRGIRGLSLEEAIQTRRSRRDYLSGPLSLLELSRLLHAASGITSPGVGFRAAPSAGALYPIETYVVVHDVAGLEPGLYHYAVADHALETLQTGDQRGPLLVAGMGQEMLGTAQVCFILSAIFQRTRWRYRERAYRYVLLEAGHIGQNLYLAATSMGLGACAVGAFLDDHLNALLGLDGQEEAALYMVTVGKV